MWPFNFLKNKHKKEEYKHRSESARNPQQSRNENQKISGFTVKEIPGSEAGAKIIQTNMKLHIEAMQKQFPAWNGLFEITTNNGFVEVNCLKGFADGNTKKAIPCLWRRKQFIENCKMFGVHRIVFLDTTNNTYDLLNIDEINPEKLP